MNTNLKRHERHLTQREIDQWLVEGPSTIVEAHLANCFYCRAKLAETTEPLAAFRKAVVAWSEEQTAQAGRQIFPEPTRSWVWAPALSIALAVALLAGFLVGPRAFRSHVVSGPIANTSVSDTVLMEQVDSEVSEAVPDALAPLTDLVAWDSKESAVFVTSEKKSVAKVKIATHTNSTAKAKE